MRQKQEEAGMEIKGYFGVAAKGFAATMQRAVRGKPLNIKQIMTGLVYRGCPVKGCMR